MPRASIPPIVGRTPLGQVAGYPRLSGLLPRTIAVREVTANIDAQPTFRLAEKHHPAVGADPPAVKSGGDLRAVDGWKAERQKVIIGHGGCGALRARPRVGFSNRILRQIKSLCYLRHPKFGPG